MYLKYRIGQCALLSDSVFTIAGWTVAVIVDEITKIETVSPFSTRSN